MNRLLIPVDHDIFRDTELKRVFIKKLRGLLMPEFYYPKAPVNPQAPVTQKIADEVVFRRFQGEGLEFFKSDLTDPAQIFDKR